MCAVVGGQLSDLSGISQVLGLSGPQMTSPSATCQMRTSNRQAIDDTASDDVAIALRPFSVVYTSILPGQASNQTRLLTAYRLTHSQPFLRQ